ncbi:MAG: diguanylate cyclase [Zetaproteobacteria bacterium CG_4_9_14_3_um_filter_53_7]|nr:MAG: diguanylate cyclase [Zetaproteobacteria bacterium CG_4_9_14_3_um_filter_53_7]
MTECHEIFPWNANFETGIALIDEQHKKLVGLINDLANHLAFQSNEITLDEVFGELADYAAYHFNAEEKLMRSYLGNDAMSLEHEATHRSFVTELTRMKANEADKPVEAVFGEILSYLSHWLAFHILESDKHMAKVAIAVQNGFTLDQAKAIAREQMSDWMKVMIETILSMYDTLSSRTLQLMREINERKKAEEKLRLAASVYDNTLEAIFITDARAVIIEINPAFSQYTGYAREEVVGINLQSLRTGLEGEDGQQIWDAVAASGHWSGEIHNRNKDGELNPEWLTISAITDEQENIINYVGLFSNITQLVQRQHKLERFAHYDTLTGLPNRLLLSDRLDQAIAKARRDEKYFAVCYLDLDHFKAVNDTFGHAAGDTLLQEISARIKGVLRAQDTIARLGGDEFVLIIEELNHPEDCRPLLERILIEVGKPVQLGKDTATVSVSIGVDFFSSDNKEAHVLLQQADQAMYHVKQSGKSNYAFFAAHAAGSDPE